MMRVKTHKSRAAFLRFLREARTREKGKIFISGPMTGRVNFNIEAFIRAETACRELGMEVENPAHYGEVKDLPWTSYLRYSVSKLITCDAIYLLPDWENSNGAQLEAGIAHQLKLTFFYAEGAERYGQGIIVPYVKVVRAKPAARAPQGEKS